MNDKIAEKLTKVEAFMVDKPYFDNFTSIEKGPKNLANECWISSDHIAMVSDKGMFETIRQQAYDRKRLIDLLSKINDETVLLSFYADDVKGDRPLVINGLNICITLAPEVEEEEDE